MEFSIETVELQNIIKLLGVSAKVNTASPEGRILIETTDDNKVVFLSNNRSTAISILADKVDVRSPGSVSVLYTKIKSFVLSFLPWDETHKVGVKDFHFVSDDSNVVNIYVDNVYENGKKAKGKLRLNKYDTYTISKPAQIKNSNIILNSTIFKTATNKILYAMNPNELKRFIQGMNVSFDEDYIYFAGTNGHMLSEYKVKNVSTLKDGSFILKYDFIMGLRRALSNETQLFFDIEGSMIGVKFDNVCFWGRKNAGSEYPDYKSALEQFTNVISLDKDLLLSNIKPFSDILDSEDNNRLSFSFKNGKMLVYCDVAEFEYDDVEYDGSYVIDINGVSFINTVEAIKDDKILLKFSDDKGSLIFDSGNFEDQKALITSIRRR